MAPQWNFLEKRFHFFLIILFEKKKVPLTNVVPFAKTAPQFPTKKKGQKWPYHIKSGAIWKKSATVLKVVLFWFL